MTTEAEALAQVVDAVLSSAKYRALAPELVQLVGAQELNKRRSRKEAIKATKNKLHQTVGAYWQGNQAYPAWLALLQASAAEPATLRTACQSLLQQHASTRERLPFLAEFYTTIFAGLPPIHAVLDLACGLNPLTIPWMPLAPQASYHACDVDGEEIAFLQQALPLLGVQGTATVCNLLTQPTLPTADVILLLKALPCLEQLDKAISQRLLTTLHAPVLMISYPAQSLGGRQKGMVDHYRAHFQSLWPDQNAQIEEFPFPTEIVFRVSRG
ncbi:MAG: hypothetical protein KF832_08405 [Caldilineaceae bacterium]|nr:hypothetical protein [Caldilineaceae bacterium]